MPVVNFIDIKASTKEILEDSLPDFEVTWGFTKRDVPRKWCYLGSLSWPEAEWATTRTREYGVSLPIIVNAIMARTTPEDAERWLAERVEAITAAFDRNTVLRDAGAITWNIQPRDFRSQPHADGVEAQAALELQVTYR